MPSLADLPELIGFFSYSRDDDDSYRGASDDELLRYGVPVEWLHDVKHVTEDTLLALSDHLPAEAAEAQIEAPSFLPTEDQRRRQRQRRALAIACIPLALLAVFQLALALRNDALETWPSLRPLLRGACRVYGCTVGWPAHSELLTIVGSELASIPGTDVIELNAGVRSRANFIMALPAIEVTLTDTQNRTVARKVFLPADYLAASGESSSRIDEGLAPGSDLSVRLVFEARGLTASGFVLYPFYL